MGLHPHQAAARRRDFCLLVTLCLVSMLLLLALTLLSPSPSPSSIRPVAADSIESRLGRTDLRLDWRTDFDQQNIQFKVTTSTSDLAWILIGFSDHGAYNGSDFCIYMDGKMKDGHLSSSSELLSDRQQDCQLSYSSPTGFSFKRKFTNCDPRDYRFEAGTTQFIIAGGYEPVRTLDRHGMYKELKYGNVMQVDSPPPSIESDAFEVEIRAESLIPASVTNYWCVVQQLPASIVTRKHHAVKIEAIVQPGNEQLVHHMEVFLCVDPNQRDYNGDCNAAGKPSESKSCSKVVAAWAMGEGPVLFPPQAGLPLGGPDSSAYVMVEIHYNNVKKLSGVRDSSGVRMTLTKRLREFNAAIMELGLIYSDANSIPPGQPAFPLTGYCVPECTKKLPPSGIAVFGSQLHAHLTGRKLWTSVYREGVKIGELNRDDHYSPHWQHLQRIQPAFRVMPGDVLATTCVYDTTARAKVTLGGYGIEDEMCVNYMYYYPASDVEVCKSAVHNATLHRWFERRGVPSKPRLSISEKYDAVEWSADAIDDLNEMLTVSPLNMHCLQHDGTLFKDQKWSPISRPVPRIGPQRRRSDDVECPAIND